MRRGTFVLLGCLIISSVQAELTIRPQGQLGGASRAIAVSQDATPAYLGVGPRVLLLDLSDPGSIHELGQSEVMPEVVADIVV